MSFLNLCRIILHGDPDMKPTAAKLKLCDGHILQALGKCNLSCQFKIVNSRQPPLLSGETCTKMGLIIVNVINCVNSPPLTTSQDIIVAYQDVFDGLGCLPGEYHMKVDPSLIPMKHTPRRAAIPLKAELHNHIYKLEKNASSEEGY